MPYNCQRTTRIPVHHHSDEEINLLTTKGGDDMPHSSMSENLSRIRSLTSSSNEDDILVSEKVGEGNETKQGVSVIGRKKEIRIKESPVFCTLEDCIAKMSLTQQEARGVDGYVQDIVINKDQQSSFPVIEIEEEEYNTNMSNSGNGQTQDLDTSVDSFVTHEESFEEEDDGYGLGLYHFKKFRQVYDSNNSNSLKYPDAALSNDNPGKKASVLSRLKNTLVKKPKYISATKNIVTVDAKRLFFHKGKSGYNSVRFTIKNITDRDVLYKVKKTDHVLHLEPRVGFLSARAKCFVQVSLVFKRRSKSIKSDWHQQIMILVTEVQDAAAIAEYSKLIKFWKHLPSREVHQVLRIGCEVVTDDTFTIEAEYNDSFCEDEVKTKASDGDEISLGGASDATSIVSFESCQSSSGVSFDGDFVEPMKQVHFDDSADKSINIEPVKMEETKDEEVDNDAPDEQQDVPYSHKNAINFDLELTKIGKKMPVQNEVIEEYSVYNKSEEGFSIDRSIGLDKKDCSKKYDKNAAEMGDILMGKPIESQLATDLERAPNHPLPMNFDESIEEVATILGNQTGSDMQLSNNNVSIYRSSWGRSPTIPHQNSPRGTSPIVYTQKKSSDSKIATDDSNQVAVSEASVQLNDNDNDNDDSANDPSKKRNRLIDTDNSTPKKSNVTDSNKRNIENALLKGVNKKNENINQPKKDQRNSVRRREKSTSKTDSDDQSKDHSPRKASVRKGDSSPRDKMTGSPQVTGINDLSFTTETNRAEFDFSNMGTESNVTNNDKFAFHKREMEGKKRVEILTSTRVTFSPTVEDEESKSYEFKDASSIIVGKDGQSTVILGNGKDSVNDSDFNVTSQTHRRRDVHFDENVSKREFIYNDNISQGAGKYDNDELLSGNDKAKAYKDNIGTIPADRQKDATDNGDRKVLFRISRYDCLCADMTMCLLLLLLWLLLLLLALRGTMTEGVCEPKPAMIWDNFGFDILYEFIMNARNSCDGR